MGFHGAVGQARTPSRYFWDAILRSLFSEALVQRLTRYAKGQGRDGLIALCPPHGFLDEQVLRLFQGGEFFMECHEGPPLFRQTLFMGNAILKDVALEGFQGQLARQPEPSPYGVKGCSERLPEPTPSACHLLWYMACSLQLDPPIS